MARYASRNDPGIYRKALIYLTISVIIIHPQTKSATLIMQNAKMTEQIDIAMSVYNGGKWLDEMLDSLANQTLDNWRLVVWNDGSTDNTAEILEKWKEKHNKKIKIVDNPSNTNLGMAAGFTRALEACDANYIMLADADDIWHPNKVEVSYKEFLNAKGTLTPQTPCLLHTDMTVIDQNKNIILESYKNPHFQPAKDQNTLNRIIFENFASSATMIMNRPLLELSLPIPPELGLQDWWFAMVACAFGRVFFCPVQTMLYRRHASNDSRWEKTTIKSQIKRSIQAIFKPLSIRRRIYELLAKGQTISKLFLYRYEKNLSYSQRRMLRDYINLRNLPFWKRRLIIIRYGLWFRHPIIDIGLLILM